MFFTRAFLDSFFCFISFWLFGIFNKRRQKGSLFFSPPTRPTRLFRFLVFVESAHKEKHKINKIYIHWGHVQKKRFNGISVACGTLPEKGITIVGLIST